MFDRRTLLLAAPALALTGAAAPDAAPDFASVEHAHGGKLGVFVIDTGSPRTLAWRADQRFPFCSSFKAPLAALVLSKVDRGEMRLDQLVRYAPADLLSYAPVARKHIAEGGLPLSDLCAAAVEYSDNTAANLLLREIGGPAALTAWMRAHGDDSFNLAHTELALNYSRFGNAVDTTTPRAMAQSFRRMVFGEVLQPASRDRLTGWLIANTTGGQRIRAGLPPTWRIGDKTGTFSERWTSCIDIAVAWPPNRAPVVIAGFVTDVADVATGEAALAEVGRLSTRWVQDGPDG